MDAHSILVLFLGSLLSASICSLTGYKYLRSIEAQIIYLDQQQPLLASDDNPNCSKIWPELQFIISLPANKIGEFEYVNWFMPSLALFWPKQQKINLLILSDVDNVNAVNFTKRIEAKSRDMLHAIENANISSVLTKQQPFDDSGWHKSQWLKFWADNFTSLEFVAFVDSDTVFVTRITERDLFSPDGRPIFRTIYGKPKRSDEHYWRLVPLRTWLFTGYKEPFNCMSQFPVVIKTAHLATIREAIRSHLNATTFDDAFRLIVKKSFYAEFNMICTLAWNLFRDEYFWVINESELGWTGSIEGQVENFAEAGLTDASLNKPRPHLAIHWSHQIERFALPLKQVLRKGICFAMSEVDDSARPWYCSAYRYYPKRNVNRYEFQFESDDFSRRPGAFQAHFERIVANAKCPHLFDDKVLSHYSLDAN